MELFDFALYAAAIIGVLWLRAETPAPLPAAPAPLPDVDLPGLEDLVSEAEALAAKPMPAVAAPIFAPTAIARLEVAPSYRTMSSQELRRHCTRRGITWAHTRGRNKHMLKGAMVAALEALTD